MVAADAQIKVHWEPDVAKWFQGAFWLQIVGLRAALNTTQQWSQ
jgi:hypothetical protein